MGLTWSAMFGATRYEFAMQIRRKSVWIAMAATVLFLAVWTQNLWQYHARIPIPHMMGNWALTCNRFLPVVFGVLLADRLQRDRRLNVTELLESTGAPSGSQLVGKYAGSTLATATPIFLFYLSGVVTALVHARNVMVVPYGLAAFAAIILPGLLFVAAFSVAVPVVLWVPLYQFMYVGYWFWGNLLAPRYGIPTLSNTFLTPLGGTAASGLLGTYPIANSALPGWMPAAWQSVVSITALLTCAIAALLSAHVYLSVKRARM